VGTQFESLYEYRMNKCNLHLNGCKIKNNIHLFTGGCIYSCNTLDIYIYYTYIINIVIIIELS
jgi:hypothetical protein